MHDNEKRGEAGRPARNDLPLRPGVQLDRALDRLDAIKEELAALRVAVTVGRGGPDADDAAERLAACLTFTHRPTGRRILRHFPALQRHRLDLEGGRRVGGFLEQAVNHAKKAAKALSRGPGLLPNLTPAYKGTNR